MTEHEKSETTAPEAPPQAEPAGAAEAPRVGDTRPAPKIGDVRPAAAGADAAPSSPLPQREPGRTPTPVVAKPQVDSAEGEQRESGGGGRRRRRRGGRDRSKTRTVGRYMM